MKQHDKTCKMTAWEAAFNRCALNAPKPQRPVCDCGADVENLRAENERLQDALWSACSFLAHNLGGEHDAQEEFDGYYSDPPRKYGEPIDS
jgi:hypothetical protein